MKKYVVIVLAMTSISCQSKENTKPMEINSTAKTSIDNIETATFAGGCFWCTEAVFLELEGVQKVVSGYIGGKRPNPTYDQVSSGATGHAEAIQITFDPAKISFGDLLEIFFATHDPTTLNRQGADVGTQYRSEVFYHTPEQQKITEAYIAQMTLENTFGKPIVTKVSEATTFYEAENYHQNYYNRNQGQSYCSYVITPKIQKVRASFKGKLKK